MVLEDLLNRGDIPLDARSAIRDEIRQRELALSALRTTERRYRRMFENSPMGILVYRLEGDGRLVFEDTNEAATRILGVDCRQFIGQTIEEAFPPLAGTQVPEAYRRVAAIGDTWYSQQVDYEHEHIRGAYEVYAFQPTQNRVVALFLDITGRKKIETQLQQSEERQRRQTQRLHAVVDIANELLTCPDLDAVYRRAVERLRDRLGVERCGLFMAEGDVLRGTYGTDDKFLTTAEHDAVLPRSGVLADALGLSSDSGPRWLVETSDHTYWRDGRTVTVGSGWIVHTPVRSPGRLPIGVLTNDCAVSGAPLDEDLQEVLVVFCSALCNIVERRRAEDETRQLETQMLHAQKLESLGVLAGGIAHDFNNILMGVLGNASLALSQLPALSPIRSYLEQVERAAVRAADLAKQMLAYSGKGRFIIGRVDVADLVLEMTHLLEASVSKKAMLRCHAQRGEVFVEADATQLRQVVMNLITNASDALGDGVGAITLRAGTMDLDNRYLASTFVDDALPAGRYSFIEVSDTGTGMDEETKQRMFDPFFSTKRVGRGLGMAAVLGIVRGHRGALKVYSELGHGTVIRVMLPYAPQSTGCEPTPLDAVASDASERFAGATILIADDEDIVRQVAHAALEMAGFSVLQARDGEEAIEVFRNNADLVSLVILDMSMPRMGGEETFRALQRARPRVPVLLSSGFNEQDSTSRIAGRGFAGFIQKPYRPAELVTKVRQLLSRPLAGGGERPGDAPT